VATGAPASNAQDQGRELPNEEPSSFDPLFERTDLGNVTQQAQMAFFAGERDLKRAAKLTAKLPDLTGKKRASAERDIPKAYAGAVGSFQEAIQLNPKMIEAYGRLSEALRLSGSFGEALKVSSRGLQLAPTDDALFAEWAESILGLDMLGDATQAYGQLRETNPPWAEVLMGVMQRWLKEHQADPQGLEPEDVQRLADWMVEQGQGAAS
jgi:tetratricopeptide (TPR) repeat protein